jgi:hypothetical protein
MAARKKPQTQPEPEEVPFFPEGHSFVKDETLESIVASQRESAAGARATEERWANQLKIASAATEAMFSGLQVATRAMGDEIQRLTLRNMDQDKKVLEYQGIIHDKNTQISEMERQSEEARLKREEQANQLKHKELDLQSKAMELAAEKEKFRETLKLVSPLVMAGGMGLKDWLAEKMAGNKSAGPPPQPGHGGGGGLPGPVPANGAGQAPRYRVTLDCIDEWRQFVALAFANITPQTAALLRALVAGGFSEAGPRMPVGDVISALRTDLGDDAMLGFMRLTGMGWAEEVGPSGPQAAQAAN